jgi:hypothetical protein
MMQVMMDFCRLVQRQRSKWRSRANIDGISGLLLTLATLLVLAAARLLAGGLLLALFVVLLLCSAGLVHLIKEGQAGGLQFVGLLLEFFGSRSALASLALADKLS